MTRNYSVLRERMETRTLANGLRICYLPKEGFSKTFAILAADFGSVDASFTLEGRRYDTPAGVAHFLEHKMFEDEDGNEITFEVIDALDHKGVHYLAVVEYVEDEADLDEDAQLVILSVGEDADGEYLDVVDDDETLMEVGALFEKRLSDNFDIG